MRFLAQARPRLGELFYAADFGNRFHAISRGVVDFRHVAYYLGVTAFFLAANGLVLERRRWA